MAHKFLIGYKPHPATKKNQIGLGRYIESAVDSKVAIEQLFAAENSASSRYDYGLVTFFGLAG